MKIAIIGGTGFVGECLLGLLSMRYDCVVLGRGKQEDLEVNGQKIPYIQTNYGNEQLLHQLEDVQAVEHDALRAKSQRQNRQGHHFVETSVGFPLFTHS